MAKKRTTTEEKRQLLLSLFKETEEVYTLKELETTASNLKGLAKNVIKETVTFLVDDGQIESGKIGTQVYFWLFKAKATQDKQVELAELDEKIASRQKYLTELEDKLIKINKDDYKDTEEEQKQLDKTNEKLKVIEAKIQAASKEGETDKLVNEANQWTDNIYLIQSYVKNKLNQDTKQLNKEFSIPEDLEFI